MRYMVRRLAVKTNSPEVMLFSQSHYMGLIENSSMIGA